MSEHGYRSIPGMDTTRRNDIPVNERYFLHSSSVHRILTTAPRIGAAKPQTRWGRGFADLGSTEEVETSTVKEGELNFGVGV